MNLPPISIIIPTRNRWERLQECIKNLREVDYPDIRIIVVCDDDKVTFDKFQKKYMKGVKHFIPGFLTKRLECVKATRYGIARSDTEFFVFYSDDFKMSKDCLRWAISCYWQVEKNGIGVVKFNDLFNPVDTTVGLLNKKTMQEHDFLSKDYVHYYHDKELTRVADGERIFVRCKEAVCEHMHFEAKKAVVDETYSGSFKWLDQDKKTYERRRREYLFKRANRNR